MQTIPGEELKGKRMCSKPVIRPSKSCSFGSIQRLPFPYTIDQGPFHYLDKSECHANGCGKKSTPQGFDNSDQDDSDGADNPVQN